MKMLRMLRCKRGEITGVGSINPNSEAIIIETPEIEYYHTKEKEVYLTDDKNKINKILENIKGLGTFRVIERDMLSVSVMELVKLFKDRYSIEKGLLIWPTELAIINANPDKNKNYTIEIMNGPKRYSNCINTITKCVEDVLLDNVKKDNSLEKEILYHV